MKESKIEAYLVQEVKKRLGGQAVKLQGAGNAGQPDRVCFLPNAITFFAEVKRLGEKPRKLQENRIKRLKDLGFCVYVPDSKEAVDDIIKIYKNYEL